MTAHPGAYVRAIREIPGLDLADPAGYTAVYDIDLRPPIIEAIESRLR